MRMDFLRNLLITVPLASLVGFTWWRWLVGRGTEQSWNARNYAPLVGLSAISASLLLFYCEGFEDLLPTPLQTFLEHTLLRISQLDVKLGLLGLVLTGLGKGPARWLIALTGAAVVFYILSSIRV